MKSIIAILAAVVLVAVTNVLWIDPFGLLTVRAPGLSRHRWASIAVGTSQEKVIEMLGEPFAMQKLPWNDRCDEQWFYSKKRKACLLFRDYRVFFSNRVVISKIAAISEDCKVTNLNLRNEPTSDRDK